MINKRSQGMPINVIVIAALALMVLVVLAFIFSNRFNIFSKTLQDCNSKQGACQPDCYSNQAKVSFTNCEQENPKKVCCIQVFEGSSNPQNKINPEDQKAGP